MEDGEALAQVPAAPGRRLHFSWGLGNELFIVGVGKPAGEPDSATVVQWGWQSPLERRVAFASESALAALRATSAAPFVPGAVDPSAVERFAARVSAALGSSGGGELAGPDAESEYLGSDEEDERGDAPDPDGDGGPDPTLRSLAGERAVWDLARALFSAPRARATLPSQELGAWLRAHAAVAGGARGAALAAATLRARLARLAPELDAGYWESLASLAAVGSKARSLRLLAAHSLFASDAEGEESDGDDEDGGWGRDAGAGLGGGEWGGRRGLDGARGQDPNLSRSPAFSGVLRTLGALLLARPELEGPSPASGARAWAEARRLGLALAPPPRPSTNSAELLAAHGRWRAAAARAAGDDAAWAAAAEEVGRAAAEGARSAARALAGDEAALAAATSPGPARFAASLALQHPGLEAPAALRELLRRASDGGGGDGSGDAGPESVFEASLRALLEAGLREDASSALSAASLAVSDATLALLPCVLAASPAGRRAVEGEGGASSSPSDGPLTRASGPRGAIPQSLAEFFALGRAASLLLQASTEPLALEALRWCPRSGRSAHAEASRRIAARAEGAGPLAPGDLRFGLSDPPGFWDDGAGHAARATPPAPASAGPAWASLGRSALAGGEVALAVRALSNAHEATLLLAALAPAARRAADACGRGEAGPAPELAAALAAAPEVLLTGPSAELAAWSALSSPARLDAAGAREAARLIARAPEASRSQLARALAAAARPGALDAVGPDAAAGLLRSLAAAPSAEGDRGAAAAEAAGLPAAGAVRLAALRALTVG